jgi:hypothetical protein
VVGANRAAYKMPGAPSTGLTKTPGAPGGRYQVDSCVTAGGAELIMIQRRKGRR